MAKNNDGVKSASFISRPDDAVTLNQACEVIKYMSVEQGLPVILWGAPGVGKTERIKEFFLDKDKGLGYDELRQIVVAWEDPTTGKGMPIIRKFKRNGDDSEIEVTDWAVSKIWAIPEHKEDGSKYKVAFFFDELANATPALTSIFQKIIHEKQVGGVDIRGCPIVAASNDVTHAAGTFRLSTAMANRFIHLNVWPSVDEFVEYAVSNNFHEWVTAFTRFQVKHPKPIPNSDKFADPLIQFDPSRNDKAFLSPRTLEYASKILQSHMSDEMKRVAIEGSAGKWYASELYSYASVFSKLPDLDEILAGHDVEIPSAPDVRYATISSLIGRLLQMCGDKKDFSEPSYKPPKKLVDAVDNSMEFAWRMAEKEDSAEFAVVFMKDALCAANFKIMEATKRSFMKPDGAYAKLCKKFSTNLRPATGG